jgi:hypothetical protein
MKRIPILLKVTMVLIAVYVLIRFVIHPPLPFSLVFMYMTLAALGTLVYVSIYDDVWHGFSAPILEFLRGTKITGQPARLARLAVLVLIPLSVGKATYQRVIPSFEPPFEQRVVHPAPPAEVTGLSNPLRAHQDRYAEYVKDGARVYYQNCFFCHGDHLDGEGPFAHGFNLPPADFVDPGTIAQLQESFVFWRVSTGGPGLPREATPWNSAMPKWDEMLSEEDRWKVVMYLYDATGWTPRTWE